MKRILIAGDSFAADWTKKYNGIGWVNMLNNDYDVKNVAEAGVSEYKIYKQLENEKTDEFDYIIISHTSPYRIPVEKHPIHYGDILHNNCDLIYSDLKSYESNKLAKIAVDFYENLFYHEYYEFVNDLLIKNILTKYKESININFFDKCNYDNIHNMKTIYQKNKGLINHMNEKGNNMVYKKIKKIING